MNFSIKILLLVCITTTIGSPSFSQQATKARPAPPGTWQQLGFTIVDFKTDKDDIWVTGADHFRKLKFKVFDAPVQMINMHVVYENGAFDNIELRFLIPVGGESRTIDLEGGSRRIKTITFWYRSQKPGFMGKAKVAVFGMK
jgi:hypothetical protein